MDTWRDDEWRADEEPLYDTLLATAMADILIHGERSLYDIKVTPDRPVVLFDTESKAERDFRKAALFGQRYGRTNQSVEKMKEAWRQIIEELRNGRVER